MTGATNNIVAAITLEIIELRKISTGSYEELFSRGKIQVDLKIPNTLDYNVC